MKLTKQMKNTMINNSLSPDKLKIIVNTKFNTQNYVYKYRLGLVNVITIERQYANQAEARDWFDGVITAIKVEKQRRQN